MQLHEATQTQLDYHAARKERLARMDARAFNAELAVYVEASNVVPIKPEPSALDVWVKRQIEMRDWFKLASDDVPRSYPRIRDIQRIVAAKYNVRTQDIVSKRRTANVVWPRQLAAYLSKDMTPLSLPEIGRRFGGRDHTTILHAVRKIERMIREDLELADTVEELRAEIAA